MKINLHGLSPRITKDGVLELQLEQQIHNPVFSSDLRAELLDKVGHVNAARALDAATDALFTELNLAVLRGRIMWD